MQEDSIFTKIINGEIPSHKVYEDEKTFAFLDISPNAIGHTLVIPKVQIDKIYDLEEDDYLALMKSVKKVANRLDEVLHPKRVGILVQGFDVPHVHVHVVPIESGRDLDNDHKIDRLSDEGMAALADRLAF